MDDSFNIELVKMADKVANEIMSANSRNGRRMRFFPEIINRMGFKTGAEVGVDTGEYSNVLLSYSKLEKLYGVDIWQNETRYIAAQEKLKSFIEAGRYQLIKKLSLDAAKDFANDSLDFVYIDSGHDLENIFYDIRAWIHKVRIGGIISGHDLKSGRGSSTMGFFGRQLRNKVKEVVEDFCPRYGYILRVLPERCPSWWFIKNRQCQAELKLCY